MSKLKTIDRNKFLQEEIDFFKRLKELKEELKQIDK